MPTIHYLQWHRSGPYRDEWASEMFHKYHHEPPTTLSSTTFAKLYETVSVVDTDDLEDIYAEWNRGSGSESPDFLDLRYCERCQSYVEGVEESITHAAQNHGYDALTDSGEPDYIRGERSMSVGDIVERDDQYYACAPIGWKEIRLIEGDTE